MINLNKLAVDLNKIVSGGAKKSHLSVPITIPQSAVNAAIPHLIEDKPAIKNIEINSKSGFFTVEAVIKKMIEVNATLNFEIIGVKITSEDQVIQLKRINATKLESKTIAGKIAAIVAQAIFDSIYKIDASEYAARNHENISIKGDVYSIDLGAMGAGDLMKSNTHIKKFLSVMEVHEIKCKEGYFEVVPIIDKERAGHKVIDFLTTRLNR